MQGPGIVSPIQQLQQSSIPQPGGGGNTNTSFRAQYNNVNNNNGNNVTNNPNMGQFKNQKSSFYVFQPRPPVPPMYQATEFDGKRLRKAIARKTVDYNTSIVKTLESRCWQKIFRERRAIQPDIGYYTELLPPFAMLDNPVNCITTKFVRTSTNKMRCPIFCVLWTPEGRRLVTGASSGEFTLWNGLTFNFETILQAHDVAVRVMVWSRSDSWMVTADHNGYVKYWQNNMNTVKMFQAHKDPIRAISFCPTDSKFSTCSDDGTIRIWDFLRCTEERILRGHGADVKTVDWHPTKALIASGSKDSQQPVKLWDPKAGQSLATIHAHKNTVMDVKWNQNGNWLLTASRDHLIKIFDIRNMSQEMQTFRGHKKEACCLSWHPIHESLFASGGSDGSILFWSVGTEKEIGGMEQAHDSVVWSLSWHPLGHILTSGSNDHTCKFWTRNRPGDKMRDKYNLNLMPKGQEEMEYDDIVTAPSIPGIEGGEIEMYDDMNNSMNIREQNNSVNALPSIPGLGDEPTINKNDETQQRKMPYSKPIPKNFQNQWSDKNNGPPVPRMGTPNGTNNDNSSHELNQFDQHFQNQQSHLNIFDGLQQSNMKNNNLNPSSSVPLQHQLPIHQQQQQLDNQRFINPWSTNSNDTQIDFHHLNQIHHQQIQHQQHQQQQHSHNKSNNFQNIYHQDNQVNLPQQKNQPNIQDNRRLDVRDIDERFISRDEDFRRWNYDQQQQQQQRNNKEWRPGVNAQGEEISPWERRPHHQQIQPPPPPEQPCDDPWIREPNDKRRDENPWQMQVFQ